MSISTLDSGDRVTYSVGTARHVAYFIRQEGRFALISTSHPNIAHGLRHWQPTFGPSGIRAA